MLHDELKNLEIHWNMLFLKTKSSNKQQKHSGVLIPGEIKKIEKVESFWIIFVESVLLLEHMMIIVACTKKVYQTRNDKNRLPWLE